MIQNIIDNRKFRYKSSDINIVLEPCFQDNNCENAEQFEVDSGLPSYIEMENTSIKEAIDKANTYLGPMTIYLYDKGCGF